MTTIDLNDSTTINGSIDYNFGRISLYPSNFLSGASASLNYSSPNIVVNINDNSSTLLNKSFIAKKIYISDTDTHGIGNGEIIIEHKDFMSSSEKLFLIIPANKKNDIPETDNAINSLIRNLNDKDNIDFNFNVSLDNETGYYYYTHIDDNSIVSHFIVFEKSVDVKDFPDSTTTPDELTQAAAADNLLIYKSKSGSNAKKTDNGVVNSMSSKEDQIYIDCQPTGVSKETIASYNVPINSEYTENSSAINFERSTTTIVFFSVACLLSFLVGPELYKTAIINNIIRHIGNQKPTDNDTNYKGCDNGCDEDVYKNEQLLGGVDTLLVIMIFWIFIAMLSVGVSYKTSLTTASLYFLMFAISMMLGIYNRRQDKDYMTYTMHTNKAYTLYEWFFDTKKPLPENVDYNFMGYNFKGIGKVVPEIFTQWGKTIALVLAILASYFITFFLFLKDSKKVAKELYGSIIMPILLFVYIIMLLAGLKKEKENIKMGNDIDPNGNAVGNMLGAVGNMWGAVGNILGLNSNGGANADFSNMRISGGESIDNNELSTSFTGLLGVTGMIYFFVAIANRKNDK